MTIIAAADGSALGNPGPAGWAWYVDDARWAAGGWPRGTNNQGELMAVIDLFESTAHLGGEDLRVLCDSQYVINAVTKWMPGWKRKGWRKADGSPVLNLDLLQRLDAAIAGRRYAFEWVKGHAGHELNEAADARARAAATAYQNRASVPTGPGWPGRPKAAAASAGGPERPAAAAASARGSAAPAPRSPAAALELDIFADDGPAVGAAPDAVVAAAVETVIDRERRLLEPAVRADPDRVAALLHPNFEEVGASGRRYDRASALRALAARSVGTRAEFELRTAERVGDGILVTYRLGCTEGSTLRSSLWVAERGQWLLRYHQGTHEPPAVD